MVCNAITIYMPQYACSLRRWDASIYPLLVNVLVLILLAWMQSESRKSKGFPGFVHTDLGY